MKFAGQIKIPDLDHPGVPARVVIDGNQVELRLESESLGRWSLVDVRAERLVSNAFSLALGNEEVTFLADDPIDFAYRGVEHMANTWAKYRAMTLPRRMVANSRSRKGTEPSRIEDLRAAMEDNLIGTALTAIPSQRELAPPTTLPGSHSTPTPSPSNRVEPTPVSSEESSVDADEVDPPMPSTFSPARAPVAPETDPGQADPSPEVDSPKPEPTEQPAPPIAPAAETASPPRAKSDSVFKEAVPWAKAKEQPTDEPTHDESQRPEPEPSDQLEQSEISEEIPLLESDSVALSAPEAVEPLTPRTEAVQDVSDDDLAKEDDGAPAPWIDPTALTEPEPVPTDQLSSEEPVDEDMEQLATSDHEPDLVQQVESDPELEADLGQQAPRHTEPEPEDDVAPSVTEDRPTPHKPKKEFVVDLGAFEDRDSPDGGDAGPRQPQPEPAMAGAERSGIMGAVKAAFVRGRGQHEHEYVEAPGGMGIVRHICTDCGHISIGVSE